MSQFLVKEHLQCTLFCCIMAILRVIFSNIRGYHQRLPELSACSLLMLSDFIAFFQLHIAGKPLQMHLPTGCVGNVHHDHYHHGGGVLLLSRNNLLVDSVDCEMY